MRAKTDKLKGIAKQIEGKLTGDKVKTAEGSLLRAKGNAEGALNSISRAVKRGVRQVKAGARARNR